MITDRDRLKIRKILVISLSNIGDVILTTPVVSVLRDHFSSSELIVMVGPKGAPVFENSLTVNEVLVFDKSVSWFAKLMLVWELRKRKFDLVIDLRNTAIPVMIGPKYRTPLFVDRSSVSMRERHLDRLRSLIPIEHSRNQFNFFTEEEKRSMQAKLSACVDGPKGNGFVVIAPGAGSALKQWTLSGFSELIDHFIGMGMQIVLVGDDREAALGKALEDRASKPVANLVGALTLRELAALIQEVTLVVANDSAVMHLAHELERPTVSIFGPTSEQKYSRVTNGYKTVRLDLECTPCEQAQCRLERRMCLDDLPAKLVIDACEELLNDASH
ncbi:MAG: glycosyltransferase family 9 protein [Candidatus Omnitrophica bacterium]|nr:glycosyltransferase family 9 protein [Candidatus Omnitrophota bacterium]